MKLAHRILKEGSQENALVFLHGLMGSSRNWVSAGKSWTGTGSVYALDLRNHGESPHSGEVSYPVMAEDVLEWLDQENLPQVILVGHSLGGKVAMRFAFDYPERISKLVVVDIAPVRNPPYHERELQALLRLPLATLETRQDVEKALSREVTDWAMRQFLLTNLRRNPEGGGWQWAANLEALEAALPLLADTPLGREEQPDCPALFIKGKSSHFIKEIDYPVIRKQFPKSQLVVIDGGHNPHMENRDVFLKTIRAFVESPD